ncbi:alcohol dehydrogenase [Candidatus Woesearchaeota archaeon]|nr:alcohol dehydrogenase [Candidatus Woesearchaeota archaeon]
MKTRAAILEELGKPLKIEEIEIPELKSGQVLVDIAYSGVCHTQVLEARGYRGEDKFLPHCLGHEGSGIVREIGPDVEKVKNGDKVILSWMQGHGINVPGTVYKRGNDNINSGGITTFSKQSVISENRLTVIPKDSKISLKDASMLGCALPTGIGAVKNVAKPKKGQSIAIFGAGGIGLCAIMGAKIEECNPIIAIDIIDKKLEESKAIGATHTINATSKDPVKELKNICPNGIDFAIESSGITKVMKQALESVKMRGGKAIVVGNAHHGETLNLDPHQFNLGKSILGTWGGDNDPDEDFSKYIEFVTSGKIELSNFTSKVYDLENINKALDDLENGKVLRPLIDMKLKVD